MTMDYVVIDGDLLIEQQYVEYKKEEYIRNTIERCLTYFVLIYKSTFAEEVIREREKREADQSAKKDKNSLGDQIVATCKRFLNIMKGFLEDESAAELKLYNGYNKVRESHPVLVPLVLTIALSIVSTLIYEICFEKETLIEIADFENVIIENREGGQQIIINFDEEGKLDIIEDN